MHARACLRERVSVRVRVRRRVHVRVFVRVRLCGRSQVGPGKVACPLVALASAVL